MAVEMGVAQQVSDEDGWSAMRELKETVFLLALTVSSMGVYLAFGALLFRVFAGGR